MKYDETIASKCRYGDIASRIFGESEIIFENSEDGYQGFANVFAHFPKTGQFAHYEWSYGSCSGCDEWEAQELSDDEIEQVMRDATAWLPDLKTAKKYLNLEDEFADASVPTANSRTNGSIPGMLRVLTGGAGSDFRRMGDAFLEWQKAKEGTL